MKLKTAVATILLSLLVCQGILAQVCIVTITQPANDTTICLGDSVYLRSEGSCSVFMNNDFENGLGAGWASANANPIFISTGCDDEYYPFGPGPSGNYCWVGVNGAYPRSITTEVFDISAGDCWVRFWMRWGRAAHSGYSDCEDPNEPDEGIHLQYSIDFGATWLDFPGVDQYPQGTNTATPPFITTTPGSGGYWTPTEHNPIGGWHIPMRYDTSAVYWWHRYSCHIPLAAITNGTMFRFLQDFNQAARSDTWGLDEVQIYCQSNPDVFWSHGPTVFNPADPVSPNVTTDYIVTVFDSVGNFATDTVTITVIPVPDPELGPDTIVCDDGVNTAYFDAGPGFDHYLWNTGDTTQVITPNTTGWYAVTATNSMCSGWDSVYLQMIPLPAADAGSDEFTCEEEAFDFSNSLINPSASNYSAILWYGGSGTFNDPTALMPVYTPAPGEFGPVMLSMVAYGIAPCNNDTSTMVLRVFDSPEADFTFSPGDSVCVNENVFFNGSATTNIISWDWNFGDGNTAIGQNVTHAYSIDGLYDVSLIVVNNRGCSDTSNYQLAVHALPSASISVMPDSIMCAEELLTFSGSSTTNIISWEWDFGDGNTAAGQNVMHVYPSAGTYNVSLMVYNENSCRDTIHQQIIINPLPSADFIMSPNDTSCMGESISFDGIGSPDIISWEWDFGDGNTASGQNVTHTYASGGTYTVSLVVANAHGCSDTAMHQRAVVDVTINFSMIPDPSCEDFVVTFNGLGNASFTDWLWDFGDGNTAVGKTVIHTYTTANTYTVTLDVCSESVSYPLLINPQVSADAGSDETTCEGYPFDLATSAIAPSASDFSSIQWSGGAGIFNDPGLLLPVYTPASGELGPVTLTMIAYGIAPCYNDTSSMTLLVIDSPEVDFTYTPSDSICVNEPVLFNGSSSTNIVSWEWDFGDGNIASVQNVTHAYSMDGLFNVSLIATNDSGCVDTAIYQLAIHALPSASISVSPGDTTCALEMLAFSGSSTTNIISWEWDFGDGNTANGQNVTHTYPSAGTYNVSLVVFNEHSCLDTAYQLIDINPLPFADFSISPNDTSCIGEMISFDATGSADIISWEWDFGDGNTASGQNVAHIYSMAGIYDVSLVVANADGCLDTAVHQRVVIDVVIDFTMIPDPSCVNFPVLFNGIGDASFTDWLWDFGDGNTAIGKNVTHTYAAGNTYTVTLTVCSESVSYPLLVNLTASANAGSDEVSCGQDPFDFSSASVTPTASDYSSILWYGGSGTFNDPTVVVPVYTPAPGETGPVVLTMVAYGLPPCGNDTSQMTLTVVSSAVANAGSDESICMDEPFDFASSAVVPFASNYDTLYWAGGAGYFVDPNVVVPVYVPAPGETGSITLTMVTSGFISNCDSVDEMTLNIYPTFLHIIDTTICFHDSVFVQGSWQYASGTFYDSLLSVHGCDSIIQTNLTVRPEIDYDFVPDPQSVCQGEWMNFIQSGSATITDFLWDFGDGQTSTQLNPSHLYTSIGNFNVTLSYTDNHGCEDEKEHPAGVYLTAEIDFEATPNPTCLNEPVSFNGYSTFNIVQWQWDFGDGQTGTGQNVSHCYNAPGTYVVALSGQTNNGCEDTATHSVYIPYPPVADFAYYIVQCDTIQFTDLSYSPAGHNIVGWLWDFGDGGSSTLQHPLHVYDSGGVYMVTLIATSDSAGLLCTDTITKPVNAPEGPTAYFTWDPEPTCLGAATSFFGTSGANIASWYWTFGDGFTATGQEPVHIYNGIDSFNVVLTVTDVLGCSQSIAHTVTVVERPDVDFTISPNPTCRDNLTSFAGVSAANICSWTWSFGDGSTGTGQYVSHVYTHSGTYTVVLGVNDSTGCANYASYPVTVNPPPTAYFSVNEATCSNDSVYFTDYSTTPNGSILQWVWDLGDGNQIIVNYPDDPDITHKYPMGGPYTVTLTVLDSDSCSDSFSRIIEIESSPIADFNNPPGCDGFPVYFTDLSSINGGSPLITWYWEFDDPNSGSNNSNHQHPAHIFSSSGIYNVTLVVHNIVNCADTIVKEVEVHGLPDVDFLVSHDTACIGEEVFFTSLAPTALTYWWEFGDGGTSVQIDPVHIYQQPGTYIISLTVVDANDCSNTISDSITVVPLPWAAFNYSLPTCNGMPILFTDESSATIGNLDQWHWYFGDGTDTIITYPGNPDVIHVYTDPGIYVSSLAVTSSNGCVDSVSNQVIVSQGPVSVFAYSDNQCEGSIIEFYDLSYAYGVNIVSWQWDFGDPSSGVNNISYLQNPTHVFETAGTYTVTLQVTMVGTCYNVSSQEIIIEQGPPVYFYTDPPATCYSDIAYFYTDPDSTNIAEVVSYFWDFDDPASGPSGTSTLQDPTHLFTAAGNYNVSLTITDIYDCQNTIVRQVNVNKKPIADFSFEKPCTGDSTHFIDGSVIGGAPIAIWSWDFGDPSSGPYNTSNLQSPSHIFSATGAYEVQLAVTDLNGCTDIFDQVVQVNESPTAAFSYSNSCDPPGTILFKDLSTPGIANHAIVEWLWELEPGIYSSDPNPQHSYDFLDSCFMVTLTVTDQLGCQSNSTQEVCVLGPPEVSFWNDDVCLGQRTQFVAFYQSSIDSVEHWVWNFNDGTPVLHTVHDTISHLFTQPGNYLVKVSAINADNCEYTTHQEISVYPVPVPNFTATIATCNDPTLFTDLSTGPGSPINKWEWEFGDGELSNFQNPVHYYGIHDSTYSVLLTVTNADGCADSIRKDVVKGTCLIASFESNIQSPCIDFAACFIDGSMLYNNEYPITRWDWDFGDGTTESYTYYKDSVCHFYENSGNYKVGLVVTAMVNGIYYQDSTSKNIQFALSPTSDFTFSKPCINEATLFRDLTSGNGTIITSWKWDFGDYFANNDTSLQQNPNYQYNMPGTYEVKLVTTNSMGCSDTIHREIEIFSSPRADFSSSLSCAGAKTSFFDESFPGQEQIYRWSWNFGDMHSATDTSNFPNPRYVYKYDGTYSVQLKIKDFNQCEDVINKVIEVNPTPESNFEIIPNHDGFYGHVLCENLSVGAISYMWDFDNGQTSELVNPTTMYEENGTYVIQLVSLNEHQCYDTAYQSLDIIIQGLFVPTAFVPEGDNPELRVFKPVGFNLKTYKIEVFSRWGFVIWSSMKLDGDGCPAEGWDGTYRGSPVPEGEYLWRIEAQFKTGHTWQGSDAGDGNQKPYGTVTLIR